jgi:prolyl-tRNA synthetase
VSGCIILRPRAYSIWEKIQSFVDTKIKKIGVKNAYFPLLIPESLLSKEQEHVEGFTPEVAWVTHAGNKKLNEKLAVRPTSETIMYPAYSKWIRSYKDLPLMLNQWCNVVRWEFKHPTPFLRGREFLWQEGHTAFKSQEESIKHNREILSLYKETFEDLLAIPVLEGAKTEKEKFAGADLTESVEIYLPNGKAIQGATTHCLGQNFAKVFNIKFRDKDELEKYVWQNSWGITTRTLGIITMMHSDDKGLVIPPKVAENKIVITPLMFEKDKNILEKAKEILKELSEFNAILDERLEVTPGFKFNEWELKGIPIRIELGPRDLKNNEVVVVRRDTGEKTNIKFSQLKNKIPEILNDIQKNLFDKANELLKNNMEKTDNFEDTQKKIKQNKIVLVPLKNSFEVEDELKEKLKGVKTLNRPLKQPDIKGKKCIISGDDADYWIYVGRSY